MAEDANANIRVDIDTAAALASIKNLQRQISAFHTSMAKGGAAAAATSLNLQQGLLNSINRTGQFSATIKNVKSTTESFTTALEKNKLSMREYFRYSAASTKTFGRFFRTEFDTINKVARERVKDLQTQYIKMGRDANGALRAIAVRPLALDMENLSTKTQIAAQRQALLNQMLKQGSTNLLNFGKNTQWAGRQLMVGFTVPLTMLGAVASKTFMDMEKQAIRFKRVYGELFTTTEETNKALEEIKKVANEFTKYGVAVSKTMELAADIAATGKMGAELTAQVAESTRLAVLGGVEQAEALKATISLTDAFGVSAEELAQKIDFLNAVENQTVTSIEDLTIAIPKAGPVVQQLGGDVKDLTFFLTAMREGGINASEGANALKSGLASIINPTGVAAEMLKGFGINLKGIVDANKGNVKGIVIDFAKALDTLDPLNRAQAIEQLFGKFQFARLSTLFQNVIKEGNQASRVLKLTNATTEELAILSERELKKVEESPMFKFQKAVEDIKVTLVPIGEAFLKAVTPVLEFGTKILEKFNELDEGAKSFVVGLTAVAGIIGPVFLMGFGLVANGVANVIKMFTFFKTAMNKAGTASTELGMQTEYMTQQQLEASAIAASLNQIHQTLTQTFTSETAAINNLSAAYRKALAVQGGITGGAISRTRTPKKLASGIVSVPGPKGAGDIIPAMLSPGEAVIPAKQAQKYAPFIQDMISGNVPGFRNGVFLGMPKSAKSVTKSRTAADEIYELFKKSSFVNTPPTTYGHQISPTSGHSFPIFGLGGVYQKGNKQVFVKPVMDEKAALAEIRATTIARQAHGLKSPDQRIVVIRDPMDVKRQRRFLALESDLDPTFVNSQPLGMFNEEQYFKQLTASLLRGDKDLSASNVYADVLADVGPAGVFDRASGLRDYSKNIMSMEEQALVNLLGVKGGAKRAFAESTLGLMNRLTPQQYHQKMIGEIQRVLPKLKQTIASFKLTNPTEVGMYDDMVRRLEAGLSVDWSKFHSIHSAVKIAKPKAPKVEGYKKGVVSVPGPKGAGDVMPAMLSPGEAVIPTKMAKKYAPLISGMISDNIPGFSKGTEYTHLSGVMSKTPDVLRQLDILIPGFSTLSQEIQDLINPLSDLVSVKPETLNQAAKRKGMGAEQFEALWAQNPDGLRGSARRAEKAGQMLIDEATDSLVDGMDADIGRRTAAKIRAGLGDRSKLGWLDKLIEESATEVIQEGLQNADPKVRNVAQGLQARQNTVATTRSKLSEVDESGGKITGDQKLKDLRSRGLVTRKGRALYAAFPDGTPSELQMGRPSYKQGKTEEDVKIRRKQQAAVAAAVKKGEEPDISWRDTSASRGKYSGKIPGGTYEGPETDRNKKARLAAAAQSGTAEAEARITAQKQTLAKEQNDPVYVQRSPKRGSPHPQAAIDGRDDAKAYSKAKREQLTKEEKYVRNLESNYRGAQVVTAQMRGERKQVEKLMKQDRVIASQARARARQVAEQQRMTAATNQVLYGTTDFTPQMRQERKRQQAAQKAANAQAAIERKALAREKAAARESQRIAATGPQQAPVGPRRRGPRMGMGGAAMVASGAVMAGSMMPGEIGKISQDLMMPVMMLSMLAPMLNNPIMLAVAAIGGLAAAAFMLDQQFKQNIKKAYELESAMGSGTKAIQPLAEFAGNVTASEILDKRRAGSLSPFEVKAGKTTFGQSFIQSEAGKGLRDTISKAFLELGKDRSVSKLVNQMATAVMSGAISPAQARSAIAALAQEMGDVSFGASVNAKLTELIGPNGENILTKGLEVRTKLIQDSREAAAFSRIQAFTQSPNKPAAYGVPLNAQVATQTQATASEIGGFLANTTAALQTQKQVVDSLQLEYEEKVRIAKIAIDTAKTEKERKKAQEDLVNIESKYKEDRKSLIAQNKITIDQIKQQIGLVSNQTAVIDAYRRTALETYKDDPFAKGILGEKGTGGLLDRIDTEGTDALTAEQSIVLNAEIVAKNIDPVTLNNILNGENSQAVVDIITKFGGTEADRFFELANLINDPTKKNDFLVKVSTDKISEADLSAMESLYRLTANSTANEIIFTAYLDDKNLNDQWQKQKKAIEAAAKKKPLTIEVIEKLVSEGTLNKSVADTIKQNQQYFDSLSEEQKINYVQSITVAANIQGDLAPMFRAWQLENGGTETSFGTVVGGGTFQEFLHKKLGFPITETGVDDTGNKKRGDGANAGGAKVESPYKNVLSDLKQLREDAVNAAGGIQELLKWLGKGKDMRPFKGTLNALIAGGTTEEFQGFVTGLEKSEQNKLFKISKGVAQLTNKGKALQKAFNEISLGRFVVEQQKAVANSKNQEIAAKRLIAAGMDTVSAYRAVEDASFAAGIATMKLGKKGREELKTIADSANAAKKAILDLAKSGDPEALQSIFDEGYGKAMEAFDAKENSLTIGFDLKVKGDKAIIAEAQDKIAKIQFQIDDYEANLQGIEDKEKKINKTYDDKLNALEKVRVANQKILDQEKGKLSVAEAITRGDLAAAAQAVQQVREASASGYFDSQASALEAARNRALGQVRGPDGLTRIQTEEKIKKLSDDILYIEEKTLEPAAERVRLAEVELQKQILAITVLNKTRLEWDSISSGIDLARSNSVLYADAIQSAINNVIALGQAWKNVQGASAGVTGPAEEKNAFGRTVGDLFLKGKKNIQAGPDVKGKVGETITGPKGNTWVWDQSDKKWINAGKLASGGYVSGAGTSTSDSIPAMLSNGEYVVKAASVNKFGTRFLDNINAGVLPGLSEAKFKASVANVVSVAAPSQNQAVSNSSVYNYNLSVNVSSVSDPNAIAQTVMAQIRRVESQKIRSNRF